MLKSLHGKKTYILSAVTILVAVIGTLTGLLPMEAAVAMITWAISDAFKRHGITTEATKVAALVRQTLEQAARK